MLGKEHAKWLGVPILACLCASQAYGQQAGSATGADGGGRTSANGQSTSAALKEVVVTATKRTENIQKVAAAVTAVTGANLASSGVTDPTMLAQAVPSLVSGAKGGVDGLVFLRGVGQTVGANNAQDGVAVNFDGVFLPREIGVGELFDLEHAEVLPGPQGTLYGGSAAGGMINFETAPPTEKASADVSMEGGNYGLFHLMGDVNAPVGDKLAVRGAFNYDRDSGYQPDGLDDNDALDGRLSGLLRATDDLSIFALVQYDHRGGSGPANLLKGPLTVSPYQSSGSPWSDSYPSADLGMDTRDLIALAKVNYHFAGDLNLSYIPSFMWENNSSLQEFQFLYGTPFATVTASFPVDMQQYTQELRLSNDAGERSAWIAGLYWERSTHYFGVGLPEPNPFIFLNYFNNLDNYAAYGQDTYSVLPWFRLVGGARITSDKFDGGGSAIKGTAGYAFGAEKRNEHVDWKAGTEVDLSASSMAYLTVQTGFVQGGYTQTPASSPLPKVLEPETLLSYTAGIKNRFLSDTLQVNDELFYYDYKDYQLQLLVGVTNAAANAPKSRIYGDQLDIKYLFTPTNELDIDAEYTSAHITDGRLPGISTDFSGYTLPGSPFLTISAGLQHNFELGNGGSIAARVQTYFDSGYWTVYTHDVNSHQDAYTRTELSATYYTPSGKWDFGAYARNLENAAVYTGCSAATAPGDPNACFIQPPRTFGVRLDGHF